MQPRLSKAVIAVVDDDDSVRQGLERLIRSLGWHAETFASAQEFLARDDAWDVLRPRVLDYLQSLGLTQGHHPSS